MRKYAVVIYNLKDPDVKVNVVDGMSRRDANAIRAKFRSGKGWVVERRTDLDTLGDIVLATIEYTEDIR